MLHPQALVDVITELQQARLLDSRSKDWLKCTRAFSKGTPSKEWMRKEDLEAFVQNQSPMVCIARSL
jgi:hypothetical protein